ncbi:hypothetical protein [Lutibaculum baratangense]|uniref:DUF4412 domain-containing protein n=1 Tax=Lutibaculum baratangense AMV1 TaxID=631454 RepID=V4R969_9HYPH|nr:hypothetical protein [Lutibaculum baratangense]ESR22741.1 hypothetical protein N177_3878 [Lutibaculum baratangense AMV1]
MRLLLAGCFAAAISLAAPAMAEPPLPQTDFSGTWVVRDGSGDEMKVAMRYSAADGAMRVEISPAGMQISAIRDMQSGDIVMWTSQMPGMGMRVKTPADVESRVNATATGETETVRGETCEIWQVDEGRACLGEGNVPLRVEVDGTTAELHDLKREPQEAAHFSPPAGLTVMDMPAAAAMQGLPLPRLPF